MKAIQYKNRAELFVLNGNKRPIRYEFHNGVTPNRFNGDMVFVSRNSARHVFKKVQQENNDFDITSRGIISLSDLVLLLFCSC